MWMRQNTHPVQAINWHLLDIQSTLEFLDSNLVGLTDVEVEYRKVYYRSNQASVERGQSNKQRPLILPWKHAFAPLILFLFFATIILVFLDGIESAISIVLIVGLNLCIVIFHIYQTVKETDTLVTKLSSAKTSLPGVKVRRNGDIQHILAHELVPGDIMLLKQDDTIVADGRLIESSNLLVCEASLTGEAYPVDKTNQVTQSTENLLGLYSNMVYTGTKVIQGRGTAVIVATGKDTRMAQILHSQYTIGYRV
jgi:Ca2+-transporting ATPase